MDIDFDPVKDAINRRQHGVSLAFGATVFNDDAHLILSTFRPEDGEHRFKVIGNVEGRLWTAVYVMRGMAHRFISVRKSNGTEVQAYHSDQG
ncbi:MAG TPA: BrnT family toxin [Sphingobium sp.]|uniref:BrnT family toxin n=1 Tax=Sphingobium sp. TaxID=1912891 RepID=UPI002ED21511